MFICINVNRNNFFHKKEKTCFLNYAHIAKKQKIGIKHNYKRQNINSKVYTYIFNFFIPYI